MKPQVNSQHNIVFSMKCPSKFVDLPGVINKRAGQIISMQKELQKIDIFRIEKPKVVEVKEKRYDFLNLKKGSPKAAHSSNRLSLRSPLKQLTSEINSRISKQSKATGGNNTKSLKQLIIDTEEAASNITNTNKNTENKCSNIKSTLFATEVSGKEIPNSINSQRKFSKFALLQKLNIQTEDLDSEEIINCGPTNKTLIYSTSNNNNLNYYNYSTLPDVINTTATERTFLPLITDNRKPITNRSNSNGIDLKKKMKLQFPSLFKSCQLMESDTKQIGKNINNISLNSERRYQQIKSRKFAEENNIYGNIERSDNVFIYGNNGEGQFLNHNNLLEEGNFISKLNSDVAFNIKNLMQTHQENKNKMNLVQKNRKMHLKVEDMIENMNSLKRDILTIR